MSIAELIKAPGPADPEDPRCVALLQNIQGNILKGHGRDFAVLIFFRWERPIEEVRPALLNLVSSVTSAAEQLRWSKQFKELRIPGGLFTNFFLSVAGYARLGFDETQLDGAFPNFDASSFRRGMKYDPIRRQLRDPVVDEWEEPYRGSIDAMLLLADDDSGFLLRRAREAVEQIEKFGTVIVVEHGAALRDERDEGVEHFGFEDGLSQPIFFADRRTEAPSAWNPVAPLSLALIKDRTVPDEAAYGSFLVFRKLEQDVRGFLNRERELAEEMQLPEEDRKRIGAMVVGRFRDGTPLALAAQTSRQFGDADDFTYYDDPDGARCPFHAHIRKVNPRATSEIVSPGVHRIVRRAIPYGVQDGVPASALPPHRIPATGVGLLFMCFQRLIEAQFNLIQATWANVDQGEMAMPTGRDALIGQGQPTAQHWPIKYGENEPRHTATFADFVKMKGGEYFFAPSIPFLKKLAP